ncbi:MAG: hypothetical protein ABNH49_13070 [Hyphomonas sp.]|jgi:hypothetical protein|tara:strand:+ start:16895 stop:17341 length:447 start_codon:yes stop_codon:yes gene_type:complete
MSQMASASVNRDFTMTNPPQNWIDPSSAFVVRIMPGDDDEGADMSVPPALCDAPAHMAEAQGAPWRNETLVSFMRSQTCRQCVVLSHTASAFATGLAVMGLEYGFDTFFVIADLDVLSRDLFTRLQQTGARLFSAARFAQECALAWRQ